MGAIDMYVLYTCILMRPINYSIKQERFSRVLERVGVGWGEEMRNQIVPLLEKFRKQIAP